MSDLSRLLGDVYQAETATEEPAPEAPPSRLPEWADDDVLDKAFASWVPGPPPDAPAAERSMLTDLAGDRGDRTATADQRADQPADQRADQIADQPADPVAAPVDPPAVATAVEAAQPERQPAAGVPAPSATPATPAMPAAWQRSDDDILVGSGSRRSLFRRSR